MRLVPLTPDYPLTAFDCGDDDLNKFLLDDAKPAQVIGLAASLVEELRIANTFIVEADDGRIAAYFCLLNDKISKSEVIGSRWKKIRSSFPRDKQFSSYPSVKIGRFAVSLDFRGENLGTDTMKKLKLLLASEQPRSAYHYLTIDAYLSAVPFYEKGGTCDVDNIVGGCHGFLHLTKKDEDEHTRLMYFDMMEIAE